MIAEFVLYCVLKKCSSPEALNSITPILSSEKVTSFEITLSLISAILTAITLFFVALENFMNILTFPLILLYLTSWSRSDENAADVCRVYSFEPSVFNLELLSRNIHTNELSEKITIVPFPLSDRTGFNNFFITTKDWGGAFSNFGESLDHHGQPISKKFYYKTLGVSMDEAVKEIKFEQPNYIKMDVDGIEHLILKGSLTSLKNVESILIEVNKNYKKQSDEIKHYLMSSGFKLKEKKQIEVIEDSINVPYFFNEIWIKQWKLNQKNL